MTSGPVLPRTEGFPGFSVRNQGKFWTNQDGWSPPLNLIKLPAWANFGDRETWGIGVGSVLWERDVLSFRHNVKYPTWRHPAGSGHKIQGAQERAEGSDTDLGDVTR